MKTRVRPADVWFSKAVRERADYHCECCGRNFQGAPQGLHCSHLYSRRHRLTRWDPVNAAAHCFTCHKRLGERPLDFAAWIEGHLPPDVLEALKERAGRVSKIPVREEPEIAAHYKAETMRLRALRKKGVTGRIEINSYFEVKV